MRRYIRFCLLVLTLCVVCTLCVTAASGDRVVDNADLLHTHEEETLRAVLDEISERRDCDIVVVTTNDLSGKSVVAYADDYYDYGGYAEDGILLLVCMETRKFHITTTGSCVQDVTERAFDAMEEAFLPDLSEGNYLDAFTAFAQSCDKVLDSMYADDYEDDDYGDYYEDYYGDSDYGEYADESLGVTQTLVISLVAGFVISFLITSSMKGKLKSVRTQVAANQYVRAGSMSVTRSHDNFLYRNITRVARPKDTSSSGGRRMGGSSHRSSSGRSHGGRSGRF